jgi:hypothetical protein
MCKSSSLGYTLLALLLITQVSTLTIQSSEARPYMEQPFQTVRFYQESIFFTTQDGRAFGYLNSTDKGKI